MNLSRDTSYTRVHFSPQDAESCLPELSSGTLSKTPSKRQLKALFFTPKAPGLEPDPLDFYNKQGLSVDTVPTQPITPLGGSAASSASVSPRHSFKKRNEASAGKQLTMSHAQFSEIKRLQPEVLSERLSQILAGGSDQEQENETDDTENDLFETEISENVEDEKHVYFDMKRQRTEYTWSSEEYDRAGPKTAKLTQEERLAIRKEMIQYKLTEMEVHPESRQYLNLYNRARGLQRQTSQTDVTQLADIPSKSFDVAPEQRPTPEIEITLARAISPTAAASSPTTLEGLALLREKLEKVAEMDSRCSPGDPTPPLRRASFISSPAPGSRSSSESETSDDEAGGGIMGDWGVFAIERPSGGSRRV